MKMLNNIGRFVKRNSGSLAGISAVALIGGIVIYGVGRNIHDATGSWNPLSSIDYTKKRMADDEKARGKYYETYGYMLRFADKDGNSILSFNEQADAWKRMGYTDKIFIESQGASQFPKPDIGMLEKAIKSYQAERATAEKEF